VVIGSERQLGLVGELDAKLVNWPSPMLAAIPGCSLSTPAARSCVLASGDPMF